MRGGKVVVLGAVLLGGCSIFTSLGGLDGVPLDETDAGSEPRDATSASSDGSLGGPGDASSLPPDAADGASPAPLVDNGGFEAPATVGCGPGWLTVKGSATQVTPGSSSAHACRVCNTLGYRDPYFVRTQAPIDGGAGTWQMQVMSRVEVDAGYPAPVQYYLYMRARLADGGATGAYLGGAVASSWQPAQLALDAPPGTVGIELEVGADGDPTTCLAVDDVVLAPP